MKIAITGKGGVGKTTIAASLSRYYADKGYNVLAVDADPDANLGLGLGMSEEMIAEITPISEMRDLAEERTNHKQGTYGSLFTMNPEVSDIPEKFSREYNGVKLLTMGTVDFGGGGCVCPEHVLLKMLMTHLVLFQKDVVVMDMEAGIEHLGRGTASAVDAFIVKKLSADIGVKHVYAIGNKVRSEDDRAFLMERIPEDALIGLMDFRDVISASDRTNRSPYDDPAMKEAIGAIGERIEGIIQKNKAEKEEAHQ